MAPLVTHLQGWVMEGGPAVTVLAFIVLLLILINLVNLCTTCQKHSFELEHEGVKVERNSSTLVRVVKLEDAAKENPAIDEIRKDELDAPDAAGSSIQSNGEAFTSWRNHTLKSVFPEDGQVGNGASAGVSLTNGGGDMDGTATARHELQAAPMLAPHVEVESSLQSAPAPPASPLAVGAVFHTAHTEPMGSSPDLSAVAVATQLTEPTANQAGHAGPSQEEAPPSSLQVPQARSQHTYEAISDILKAPTPTPTPTPAPSESSEGPPLDVPSYQFVTQLEPYATSIPDLSGVQQPQTPTHPLATHTASIEVEEIADLEDRHSTAMYARVSKRIKCPTPPPMPPPDEVEEEAEEPGPPLPDRAPDSDQPTAPLEDSPL